ncbi:MAG TPA: hypothetical protein VJN43_15795 [Bryobacteraceae bacterium]|nr:hypothetical protein [Bryobacteraceae bacterium]
MEFKISERGKTCRDPQANTDQPQFFADHHFVDGQQQESEGDGEIPPGVEAGMRWKSQQSSSRLQKVAERFKRQPGITYNAGHCVGIYRIITGNCEQAASIGHDNVFALANDSKASLLQRPDRME